MPRGAGERLAVVQPQMHQRLPALAGDRLGHRLEARPLAVRLPLSAEQLVAGRRLVDRPEHRERLLLIAPATSASGKGERPQWVEQRDQRYRLKQPFCEMPHQDRNAGR